MNRLVGSVKGDKLARVGSSTHLVHEPPLRDRVQKREH
jgi:hypothetical protein